MRDLIESESLDPKRIRKPLSDREKNVTAKREFLRIDAEKRAQQEKLRQQWERTKEAQLRLENGDNWRQYRNA